MSEHVLAKVGFAAGMFFAAEVVPQMSGLADASTAPTDQFARCYPYALPKPSIPPEPGPNASIKQINEWTYGPAPINVRVENGVAEGDPITPSKATINRVASALVEITTSTWKGSGFITTDPEDQQVVVTAAHVIGNQKPSQITITTSEGVHVEPTGGCYIYDSQGKLKNLESDTLIAGEEGPDNDIAVLTLNKPLTSDPLEIAKREPKPGTWVDYVNYQEAYGPVNSEFPDDGVVGPAAYTGLMSNKEDYTTNYQILTGLQTLPTDLPEEFLDDEYDATHQEPGASGGPVVDKADEVIGVSIDGTDQRLTDFDFKYLYGAKIEGVNLGKDSGFNPVVSSIVPVKIIDEALDSPKV